MLRRLHRHAAASAASMRSHASYCPNSRAKTRSPTQRPLQHPLFNRRAIVNAAPYSSDRAASIRAVLLRRCTCRHRPALALRSLPHQISRLNLLRRLKCFMILSLTTCYVFCLAVQPVKPEEEILDRQHLHLPKSSLPRVPAAACPSASQCLCRPTAGCPPFPPAGSEGHSIHTSSIQPRCRRAVNVSPTRSSMTMTAPLVAGQPPHRA